MTDQFAKVVIGLWTAKAFLVEFSEKAIVIHDLEHVFVFTSDIRQVFAYPPEQTHISTMLEPMKN